MKKNYFILSLLLIFDIFLLSGCSEQEIYVIQPEYEALVFADEANAGVVLGRQYYQGKEILFTGLPEGIVYLCKEGEEAVEFVSGVSQKYISLRAQWWMDKEGNCYVLYEDTVMLLDREGKTIGSVQAEGMVTDICESSSGKIVAVISKPDSVLYGITEINMKEGKTAQTVWLKNSVYGIGTGHEKDVLIVDEEGIYDYNISDKSKQDYMKWNGSAYSPSGWIEDINFVSDSQIELYTAEGMITTLKKYSLNNMDKTVLTYKALAVSDGFKELIVQFNRENPDYYIQLTECGKDTDADIFKEKVSMEIAAGYGPDIISDNSVADIYVLYDKGALEELTPYMEKSSIEQEEYFPAAFQGWGLTEGIYGIGTGMSIFTWCIENEVVSGNIAWDIDSMLDTLENFEGDKAYDYERKSADLLCSWLSASDNLFGMVNWETGTCDFSGDRWERLLKTALRYGFKEENKGKGWIAYRVRFQNYNFYSVYENGIKTSNKTVLGLPGEKDGVIQLNIYSLGMNADSDCKEGVWKFFEFLLNEETQTAIGKMDDGYFPVNRQAFWNVGQYWIDYPKEMELFYSPDGWEVSTNGLTRDQLASIEGWFEKAVYLPWRTAPILEIIEEETQMYFNGVKSMEEVTDIIENRVQLYLDENM